MCTERRRMEEYAKIGMRIRDYLHDKGIKQKFLSDKTGISQDTISAICRGVRKVQCLEYHKICKALDVPYDYFIQEGSE